MLARANPTVDFSPLDTALNDISDTNTQLVAATTQASNQAAAVNTAFDSLNNAASGDISGASSDITALATGAAQVSTGVQGLNTGISTASSGASTLDSGIGELSTAATTLDTGIGTLQLGAQKLDDGLGTLETGATTLVTGVTAISTGATQLAADLTAGAARIPTLAPDQEANSEQVLSSPADVQVTIDNPATVYGRGLAPFFFAIAIWVFGISVFLVMRPISGRALASRASSPRITIAGWLPVLTIAALGSLIMLGVVWLGLGLNPVNIGGSIGVVLLAAACFTAIAHLLPDLAGGGRFGHHAGAADGSADQRRRPLSDRDAAGAVPRHSHLHPDDVPGRRPAHHLHRRSDRSPLAGRRRAVRVHHRRGGVVHVPGASPAQVPGQGSAPGAGLAVTP